MEPCRGAAVTNTVDGSIPSTSVSLASTAISSAVSSLVMAVSSTTTGASFTGFTTMRAVSTAVLKGVSAPLMVASAAVPAVPADWSARPEGDGGIHRPVIIGVRHEPQAVRGAQQQGVRGGNKVHRLPGGRALQ